MSWRVNSCVVHAFLWNVSMQIISHVTCRFPAPCRNQSSEVFYEWGMQPPLVLFALSSGSLILFSWVKSTQGWNAYSVSCTQIKSDTYICKGSSKFVFCFYSLAKIETWFLFFFLFFFLFPFLLVKLTHIYFAIYLNWVPIVNSASLINWRGVCYLSQASFTTWFLFTVGNPCSYRFFSFIYALTFNNSQCYSVHYLLKKINYDCLADFWVSTKWVEWLQGRVRVTLPCGYQGMVRRCPLYLERLDFSIFLLVKLTGALFCNII